VLGVATLPPEIMVASTTEKNVSVHEFTIDGRDFANSGILSTQIKTILKDIGFDPKLVRRVAISTYEGEMNVVMHAVRARVTLTASDQEVVVVIDDEGKGIPDIEMAMQEGFSTATEDQRALGFGAGMGLPNIKKNSDVLNISSVVGKGTRVEMRFLVG
jgi:anti-sigma regulatory factor (Ser/Thr protein kinase)